MLITEFTLVLGINFNFNMAALTNFCIALTLSILLIPILIYRWILKLCTKCVRPDLSHMLRGQGWFFMGNSGHSDRPCMNLVINFHMEGLPDFETIKKLASERVLHAKIENGRILAYPELQQYCVKWGGYFFWKYEESFSIDEHVQLYNLSPNENMEMFQVKYLKEPLPEKRSPWQIIVINNVQPQAADKQQADSSTSHSHSYHILFKCHHSLGDGHSLMEMLSRMLDPDVGTVFLDPSQCMNEKVTVASRVLRCLKPRDANAMRTVESPNLPWSRSPPPTAPSLADDGVLRSHHFYLGGGQFMEMPKIKDIASRHSISTTAVIYGAVTGALRAHLLTKYNSNEIPSHLTYMQSAPVPRHPRGLCNALTSVTFQLPIGEPDPVARLQACHKMIQNVLKWSCIGDEQMFTEEELGYIGEGIRKEFEVLLEQMRTTEPNNSCCCEDRLLSV